MDLAAALGTQVRGVPSATCDVRRAMCHVRRAMCYVRRATCPPLRAKFSGALRRGLAGACRLSCVRQAMAGVATLALACATAAAAEERYALIVAGASGGSTYLEQYGRWTTALSNILVDRMKFDPSAITVLGDKGNTERLATAENVRAALAAFQRRMSRDDLLFVFLIGHGTFDGVDAKFNLIGRDLESSEWAAALRSVPGRLVVVNTTAASFPFIERLSAPRRIVISATDSALQRYDTVFPEYFIKAFEDEAADIDKNGRTSVWEAFAAATAGVRRYYQQRGQLATERALLDDNGDGIGKEAADPGADGSTASRTYLDHALPGAAPTDEVMLKLLQRRTALETEAEELKIRRSFLPPEEYAREFERVMIELARVSRAIRERQKT